MAKEVMKMSQERRRYGFATNRSMLLAERGGIELSMFQEAVYGRLLGSRMQELGHIEDEGERYRLAREEALAEAARSPRSPRSGTAMFKPESL